MDYKTLYKNKGLNVRDCARARVSAMAKSRMDKRMTLLDSKRNLGEITTQASAAVETPPKANTRIEMLAKWKAQKQKAMMESKKKQKPVFKVGIVQRTATGSPLLKMTNAYAEKNFLNPQQISKVNKAIQSSHTGILTRAKAKAIENDVNMEKTGKLEKIVNNKRKQIKRHAFKVPQSVSELASKLKMTIPQSPQVLKRSKNMSGKKNDAVKVLKVVQEFEMPEIAEEKENIKTCTPKKKESPKERIVEKYKSPIEQKKTETSADFIPIHYSPFVNKSRGSEIRSPRKTKINLTLNVDELIKKEENEFKCRIFSFRKYIECETQRLLDLCNKWRNTTKGNANIPDDVEDELLSLYGKTTLLTSDKFMQFRDIINKCEKRDPMVKIDDLQGYQDWVAIEVDGLDQAFLKLEERKARNWKEEEKQPVKCQVVNKPTKPVQKKVAKPQGVRSNIREHILAARKLKQNAAEISEFQKLNTWAEARSPVKTPRKSSILLKEVLTSEAEKANASARKTPSAVADASEGRKRFSGFEIMAATKLAKCLTPSKTTPNKIVKTKSKRESRTPLRSILKQTPASMNSSKHSVQFRLSGNKVITPKDLGEENLLPVVDEDTSFLSMKMDEFGLTSPKESKGTPLTSTPIRKSARLATK